MLAGIAWLKETPGDRALPLFMLRTRREKPVAQLSREIETEAQGLRDRCALACLSCIGAIVAAYDRARALLEREGIDDPAVDLWSPLAAVADDEDQGNRAQEILEVARELSSLRDAEHRHRASRASAGGS